MTRAQGAVELLETLAATDTGSLPAEQRQAIITVLRDGAERFLPFAELARFAEYGFRAEGSPELPIDALIRTTRTALLDDEQPEGSPELLAALSWSVQNLLSVLNRPL